MRKLEVVSSRKTSNKEVGGHIALNDESSVTQSVTYVGIKLLWQLKNQANLKEALRLTVL